MNVGVCAPCVHYKFLLEPKKARKRSRIPRPVSGIKPNPCSSRTWHMPRSKENGVAVGSNPWSDAVPGAGVIQHPLCLRTRSSPQATSKLGGTYHTSGLLTQTVVLREPKVLTRKGKHAKYVDQDAEKTLQKQLRVRYACKREKEEGEREGIRDTKPDILVS